MSIPRILPLVAVAGAGLLVLKVLGVADALPQMFAAPAQAEGVAPHVGKPGKALAVESAKPDAPAAEKKISDLSALGPANAPRPAAPMCTASASELAKEAGLSPAELQVLQNLGTRRGQLDAREQALDGQLQLLAAAEAKVDAKLKGLKEIEAQMHALMGQVDAQTQAEVDRLTVVYAKMKPADAGAIMAQLDDRVRIPIAASLSQTKPAILAAILSKMGTLDAKKLTESLAHRFAAARDAAQAVSNGAAPAVASAGLPAAKAAAAAKIASAAPADATAEPDATVKPEASKPKPHAKKPVQVARATPRKPRTSAAKIAPAAEKPITEKPAPDKAVAAKPASEKPAEPKAVAEKAAPPKPAETKATS